MISDFKDVMILPFKRILSDAPKDQSLIAALA
jgi:hypothetical protein